MSAQRMIVLLMVAVLVGCATEPVPISYYMLTPPVAVTDTRNYQENEQTLVIENVELAEYLRQSGLVFQSGDNQVVVSKSHLWAENLGQALPKALLSQLQQKSRDYSFYLKASDYVKQTDYRLRLHVDSLQATDRGEVVTAGRFQLISSVDAAHPVSADFYFRRDLEDNGYAHAVEQMRALVGQIADAVLDALNDLAVNQRIQETEGH